MKQITFTLLLIVATALSGCVAVASPTAGSVYTNTRGPVAATSQSRGTKVGSAESTGILFFAYGDASIEAAALNGGITKVSHVDHESFNFLGLYAKYTTKVYGQ